MKIKYRNFDDGVHYFTLTESTENLNLGTPFFDIVNVDCKMDKSMHQILLTGEISLLAELDCDRCGKTYKASLSNELKIVYFFDRSNVNEDNDSTVYLSPVVDKIDISEDVRELSFLSIPMKSLCREDCKGLCSNCGVDLNIDECTCKSEIINPQWEELLKLKNKLNKKVN